MPLADGSPLAFPCDFPIKVMGRKERGFAQTVADIVRKCDPGHDPVISTYTSDMLFAALQNWVKNKSDAEQVIKDLVAAVYDPNDAANLDTITAVVIA